MAKNSRVYLGKIEEDRGVSLRILRRLAEQMLIPAHRFPGGRWFVLESDLPEVERILADAGHTSELTGVSIGQKPQTLTAS